MIKYKTGGWGDQLIEKVEVVKETDKTLWIKTEWRGKESVRACRKNSSYDNFFDSFDAAKEYLILKSEDEIRAYQDNIEREQKRLKKIKSLTEAAE